MKNKEKNIHNLINLASNYLAVVLKNKNKIINYSYSKPDNFNFYITKCDNTEDIYVDVDTFSLRLSRLSDLSNHFDAKIRDAKEAININIFARINPDKGYGHFNYWIYDKDNTIFNNDILWQNANSLYADAKQVAEQLIYTKATEDMPAEILLKNKIKMLEMEDNINKVISQNIGNTVATN